MNDHCNALFIIGYTKAISAVAVDAERLISEHAAQVNRIHVRQQQNVFVAAATKARMHHATNLLRCIKHAVGVITGFQQLDFAAQSAQLLGNKFRYSVQAFTVTAAGLNRHQLRHGFNQRVFLRGGGCQHRTVRRRLRGLRKQR